MEREEKDKGKERVRRREHIGEEERNRGRESVKRRGGNYYKWQYNSAFSFAPFKLNCSLGFLATLYTKCYCVAGTC